MTCFPTSSFPFLLFLFLTPSFFILFLFCLVGLILGPNWAFFSRFFSFFSFFQGPVEPHLSLFSLFPFPSPLLLFLIQGWAFLLSFFFITFFSSRSWVFLLVLSPYFFFFFLLFLFFNLGWAKPHWFSWAESHRIRLAPLLFLGLG